MVESETAYVTFTIFEFMNGKAKSENRLFKTKK
jgi:hypothetical protein